MGKWLSLLIFLLSLLLPLTPAKVLAVEAENTVLINEIRLGGEAIAYGGSALIKEYVTLFNSGASELSLEGWALEYAKTPKPGLSAAFCSASSWSGFDNITVAQIELSGIVAPYGVTSPIEMQLNDSGPGSLRLIDATNPENVIVHDLAGWGEEAPCKEKQAAQIPANGKSLTRYVSCDTDLPFDTNDNLQDFVSNPDPVPGNVGNTYREECTQGEPVGMDCGEVTITEILPNAQGSDTGKEFIEIHNPTSHDISLEGCQLGLQGLSKVYMFTETEMLKSGQYRAYYNSVTGITLPNTAGGTVLLVAGQNEFAYSYPGGLKDDIAWADIAGEWQQTDSPTPGAVNKPMSPESDKGAAEATLVPCPAGKYRNPETNRCKNIETARVLAPCEEGKERNPETNRCRSIIATLASLMPCKEGQVRNPATNRCRSVVSASSKLTPCKPGQERNPETNRCRKVASAASELKPCKEGQERNPETNRCRKVQATLAAATDLDDTKNNQKNLINYGLLSLVGVSAIGYGVYEYRNDFRHRLSALKNRFFPGNHSK